MHTWEVLNVLPKEVMQMQDLTNQGLQTMFKKSDTPVVVMKYMKVYGAKGCTGKCSAKHAYSELETE